MINALRSTLCAVRGMLRRRFRALSALLLTGFLLAPPAALAVPVRDDTGQGAGFTSVLYDSTSGLPTSEANAIVQSKDGFLWLGGYSGLIRYDGNNFERFDSSTGVSSVRSLFFDSQERLWIGTNDNGVARLKDNEFVFYSRDAGLQSSSIQSFAEDREGNILIATTMGLAYIDGEDQLRVINDPQVNREYVVELFTGDDGVIYGVTNSGAFFTVENRRVTAYYSSEDLGHGVVNTIYPDPLRPGFVYLGTQGSELIHGDITADLEGASLISVEPLVYINAVRLIDGLLWLCADNGIGYLDEEGRFVQLENLPMTNSIDHVMADYQDNLWFTSSRQGVMKIVENRFTDVSRAAGLETLVVNTTCSYQDCLYIGTDTGLYVLDRNYGRVENSLTELMAGVRIRCIRTDSRGNLWLCTNSASGLVRYEGTEGTIEIFNESNGLASNRARTILELSDGRLAVATNRGVNLIEDGGITATYNSVQGLSNLEILCLEEDAAGRIFLGSDGDGIYIVDGTRVSRVGLEDGLSSEVILRIKRDPVDGDLFWIITSSSLGWMRNDQVTTLRNFPYSNNFDLYFNDDGQVWVLSSNGIYVVSREDLLADEEPDYILYDTESGLPCVATANSYSQLEADGTLFIAGSKGVSAVNINLDTEDNSEVKLSVPFLTADEEYIAVHDPEEAIHISPDCKRLIIYPYAFTYSLNNPHVSFYLEGFDDEPVQLTKRDMTEVTYTNLDGGTYRFHLSVVNLSTGEADQTLTITLVKDMALHEQLWFRALMVLVLMALAALAVLLYFRRKTAALMRKHEETRTLVNEMTNVFAKCVDMKDAYTRGHSIRVAKYSSMLAEKLGKSKEEVEEIYNIALLHDIGKISIPDNILNKPGRLTDEEFGVMKSHAARGYDILKEITIAPELALGAGFHHERIDGKGYPRGLKGDEIPYYAQIIAVADTFDAMYSTRPYRKQMELSKVAEEIKRCAGTQLNAEVVEAFLKLVDEGAFGAGPG